MDTFSAILTFLNISDFDPTNDHTDCLFKVWPLLDSTRANCKKFYEPYQLLSADERMVKTKDGSQASIMSQEASKVRLHRLDFV